MKHPKRFFLGWSWVGWLNFIVLQWFCIRLAYVQPGGDWAIFCWPLPLTGWWSDYRYIPGTHYISYLLTKRWRVDLAKYTPRVVTLFLAQCLRRLTKIGEHDIVLFVELERWIADENNPVALKGTVTFVEDTQILSFYPLSFHDFGGVWFMRISDKGKMEFNRTAHPEWTEDEFAKHFIALVEAHFFRDCSNRTY